MDTFSAWCVATSMMSSRQLASHPPLYQQRKSNSGNTLNFLECTNFPSGCRNNGPSDPEDLKLHLRVEPHRTSALTGDHPRDHPRETSVHFHSQCLSVTVYCNLMPFAPPTRTAAVLKNPRSSQSAPRDFLLHFHYYFFCPWE